MKIIENEIKNITTFGKLKIGDIFKIADCSAYFIKLPILKDTFNANLYNYFNLTNNYCGYIEQETEIIICPNATLIINYNK